MSKSSNYQPNVDQEILPSAYSLFSPNWKAVKVNLLTIVELTLIPVILNLLAFLIFRRPNESSISDLYGLSANQIILGLGYYSGVAATALSTLFLLPAATLVYLESAKLKPISLIEALKRSFKFWFRYIVMMLILGAAVIGGLILFIVPGIIVIQRFYLAGYYLIDHNMKPVDALKRSWRETKIYSSAVWGVLGVTIMISLAGSILGSTIPFVNILAQITLLVYACAPAIRYLQIKKSIKKLS